jgi:hypothetical protein
MANKLTGRARVHGLAGALTYASFPANAFWMPQGATLTHEFQSTTDLKDPVTGEVIGLALGCETRTLSIEILFTSDADGPHTAANAAAGMPLPTAPCKVTLSAFADTNMNGFAIYKGGASKTVSPDGDAKMTLPLTIYVALSEAQVDALVAAVT